MCLHMDPRGLPTALLSHAAEFTHSRISYICVQSVFLIIFFSGTHFHIQSYAKIFFCCEDSNYQLFLPFFNTLPNLRNQHLSLPAVRRV